MSVYNVDSLRDISVSTTKIANAKPQGAGSMQAVIRDVNARLADLADAMRALATCQAGASAPANRRGALWFDTVNDKLYLDPDGAGADDDIAHRLKAYGIAFATAGTGTFKLGGPINVDTTDTTRSDTDGVLSTYNVPANTLNSNADVLHAIGFGSHSASSSILPQVRLGGTALATMIIAALAEKWYIETLIIRTSAGNQKSVSFIRSATDANGATMCDVSTSTKDETAVNAIDFFASDIIAGDTMTQISFIVEKN